MKTMMHAQWEGLIVADPRILGGCPVVNGTRVAVQVIVGSLASGMPMAEVCEQYRLTEEQVKAALAYAADVLAEERVYALAGGRGNSYAHQGRNGRSPKKLDSGQHHHHRARKGKTTSAPGNRFLESDGAASSRGVQRSESDRNRL